MVKHIWFDFGETIAFLKKDRHNHLRYESYAEVVGKPLTDALRQEYEDLYKKFNHSNSAIFCSLGLPSNYWSERISTVPVNELFTLTDEAIPETLKKLKEIVPISVFSNIQLESILPNLGINTDLFTHFLSFKMLKELKPALEGFYKMVELSALPPHEILYIGEDLGKDVLPAKKVGILSGLMWAKSEQADYCFDNFEDILRIF